MKALFKKTILAKDILPVVTLESAGADPNTVVWFGGKAYTMLTASLVDSESITTVDGDSVQGFYPDPDGNWFDVVEDQHEG